MSTTKSQLSYLNLHFNREELTTKTKPIFPQKCITTEIQLKSQINLYSHILKKFLLTVDLYSQNIPNTGLTTSYPYNNYELSFFDRKFSF